MRFKLKKGNYFKEKNIDVLLFLKKNCWKNINRIVFGQETEGIIDVVYNQSNVEEKNWEKLLH